MDSKHKINPGKAFENEFKNQVPEDVWLFRIKDPAQSFGNHSGQTRFQPKSEFDFLMFKSPTLYALELKQTKGTQFQWSLENNKQMIKASQIDALRNMRNFQHTVSGFLFNFRKTEHTYFLPIEDFDKFLAQTDKKSINEKDVISFNGILLQQTRKRVYFRYDITPIIEMSGGD